MALENGDYAVGIRFWIKARKGHFLGAGRIQLLEQIKRTGSITKGAQAMKNVLPAGLANTVEDMNKQSPHPLVEKILGGKGGGGALVTESGEKAIQLFHTFRK